MGATAVCATDCRTGLGTGYLTTSQALLARLETSVAIWFFLLVVYHIIRRWMLIQRRRIAFDRAKQRRADILAQRARGEEEAHRTITVPKGLLMLRNRSLIWM